MDLQGRIKLISVTQSIGVNGFLKREVVITTEEQYPQNIIMEFHQDKCVLLDNFRVGQLVKISFNVRGREWINPQGEAKYFNTLQGWRIENMEVQLYQAYPPQAQIPPQPYQQTVSPPSQPVQGEFFDTYGRVPTPAQSPFPMTNTFSQEDKDDLPF